MKFLSFIKSSVLIVLVVWLYYLIQFRRWNYKVRKILTMYCYANNERTIEKDITGKPGLWAIEILYYYEGQPTGYLVKYEVTVDPLKLTNTLVFSYWIAYLVKASVRRKRFRKHRTRIHNYICYQITDANRNACHWDSLIMAE